MNGCRLTNAAKPMAVACWVAFGFLSALNVHADDLADADVVAMLNRLSGNVRGGPFGRRKIFVANDKNEIVELKLSRLPLDDKDFRVIGELQKLHTIDLSRCKVTDTQMGFLSRVKNLRILNLSSTPITDEGLMKLRMQVLLERLNVGRTKISSQGLAVCKSLPNLEILELHGCKIDDGGVQHLTRMKKLQLLKMGDTNVTDASIELLLQLKSLEGVLLDGTKVTQNGLEKMATSKSFQWISQPGKTVDELVRRMEAGAFSKVNAMTTVGLILPGEGKFKKDSIVELEQSAKDKKTGRQRFQIALRWEKEGRKPTLLKAQIGVDRGAIRVAEMGIKDIEIKGPSLRIGG